MQKYLKRLARFILRDDLDVQERRHNQALEAKDSLLKDLKEEHEKHIKRLERTIKKMTDPESVVLSFYRIDNVGPDGIPPSYLSPGQRDKYIISISELDSVYRNTTFKEMIAWALNFHANLSLKNKMKNDLGDEIDVSSEQAKYMIMGIRSIWELLVAAHNKDRELTASKDFDPHDILDVPVEEGIY